MRSTLRSLEQVAYVRPLSKCSVEELAVYQKTRPVTGGVAFARKLLTPEKNDARQAVIDLLMPEPMPGPVSILSMPGLSWEFERKVLHRREGKWHEKEEPDRTEFTCIENDRTVFHGGLVCMPGLDHPTSLLRFGDAPRYAEQCARHTWIDRYLFGNVDDLMQDPAESFDVAWLDYTGPLSAERMRLIRQFYRRSLRHTIIITALKARWNAETVETIQRHGGYAAWVSGRLPGEVVHTIEYQDSDGSPMIQIAITKEDKDDHPEP